MAELSRQRRYLVLAICCLSLFIASTARQVGTSLGDEPVPARAA